MSRPQWDTGQVFADEIGVSPSLSPKFPNISVPYGALVPAALDNILGAGRHVSCDASSHTFLREIPQCWLTGEAAGVGQVGRDKWERAGGDEGNQAGREC